ncbi:exosortase/archaeosortase family protein [Desulfurococcaceae archaeon MEX13E-LK6-19]|nr:exosortase/archaeosortase family protein [Desulfurococcaceae archaeon MEX13E-LK6-19]
MYQSMCPGCNTRGFIILVTLVGIIASFIELIYKDAILAYFLLLETNEYSYLAVISFIVLLIAIMESCNVSGVKRIHFGRVLVASVLIVLSYVLLMFSYITNKYILEFKIASIIFLVWGFSAIIFSPRDFRVMGLPLLALVFLIPIPRSIIDEIALYLSQHVASVVSFLTGSELVKDGVGQQVFLKVIDSSGNARLFEIAGVCSGIISLLSILSLVIMLAYFLVKSKKYDYRKILGMIGCITVGIIVVYIGNIIRVTLVVLITKYWSYEAAMSFFHTVPSIIYSAIAVVVVVLLAHKILGISNVFGNKETIFVNGIKEEQFNPKEIGGVLFSLLIITSIFTGLYASLYSTNINGSENTFVLEFQELFMNATKIVFNGTGAIVLEEIDRPTLIRALGSSLVKEIIVRYKNDIYTGYIEVAETPSRFHSWSVCLTFQRYIIEDEWSVYLNNTVVVFMLLRSVTGEKITLAYSVYEVPVYFGGKKIMAYVRVSLFKHGVGTSDLIELFSKIQIGTRHVSRVYEYLLLWVNITTILLAIVILYALIVVTIHIKTKLERR